MLLEGAHAVDGVCGPDESVSAVPSSSRSRPDRGEVTLGTECRARGRHRVVRILGRPKAFQAKATSSHPSTRSSVCSVRGVWASWWLRGICSSGSASPAASTRSLRASGVIALRQPPFQGARTAAARHRRFGSRTGSTGRCCFLRWHRYRRRSVARTAHAVWKLRRATRDGSFAEEVRQRGRRSCAPQLPGTRCIAFSSGAHPRGELGRRRIRSSNLVPSCVRSNPSLS
jgi:hypothetical protein